MFFLLGFSKAHKRLLKVIEYRVVSRTRFSPRTKAREPITLRRAKCAREGPEEGQGALLERASVSAGQGTAGCPDPPSVNTKRGGLGNRNPNPLVIVQENRA